MPRLRKNSTVAPLGATPSALIAITRFSTGCQISACVSPPQCSVSHIVAVAAIIAQAASTALPPRSNIFAPAVAPSGLPVIAIHSCPCTGGFSVRSCAGTGPAASRTASPERPAHSVVRNVDRNVDRSADDSGSEFCDITHPQQPPGLAGDEPVAHLANLARGGRHCCRPQHRWVSAGPKNSPQ